MKNKVFILFAIITIGCKQNNSQMAILKTREEAIIFVDKSFSDESETLIIANELLDPMGMNMAIIADGILKKVICQMVLNKRMDIVFISI